MINAMMPRPKNLTVYLRDQTIFSDGITLEKTWTAKEDTGPGDAGFYLDLYDALRNGKRVQIKPEQVRRQLKVLEQCRKTAPV